MSRSSRAQEVLLTFIALFLLFLSPKAFATFAFNMTPGITSISRDVHALHMLVFWICVGIGIVVFSVMFYSIIWHRKSRGVKAAHFHEHPIIEIIWTIIPVLILVALAIPSTKVLIEMNDTSDSYLTIKITGHQWRWEYEYLGTGLRFVSNLKTPQDQIQNRDTKGEHYLLDVDKPLIVPIGKKIRFLTTASDVIHSWWMPALGFKKDAIPGFINEAWGVIETTGTYRGQCAELCGVNHGFMPIVLIATTEEEYQDWLTKQLAPLTPAPASATATPAKTTPASSTSATATAAPESTPSSPPTSPSPTTSTPAANAVSTQPTSTGNKSKTVQPSTTVNPPSVKPINQRTPEKEVFPDQSTVPTSTQQETTGKVQTQGQTQGQTP